tara:strand:+ start:5426 stop:6100 length:675 start_codon:yes stop_codon:yes gene_type:complete
MTQDDNTREKLKLAAMRLFSLYGVSAVSVRDIMKEAGTRNSASLHYYFGTKDELIDELVVDSARRSDTARHAKLDRLEAMGLPISVEHVVRVIVEVETTGGEYSDQADLPIGFGHMRFVSVMQLSHREQFLNAIGDRWNGSYLRCLDLIRRNLNGIRKDILDQRLIYMFIFINSTLASREAAFVSDQSGGPLWGHPLALKNLIGVITAGLEAEVDPILKQVSST